VASDDVILVCAPKRDPVYAIKAGGNGQLDEEAIAWTSKTTQTERSVSSDVPTPAYYDGDFFVLSDVRSMLSRVDPKTGQPKWTVKTPGPTKYEASPLVADGKVFLINHVAEVAVVNAENGAVISEIEMGGPRDEPVRSSIIAAQGQLFVRTNTKLYCIEQAR
jgi:outer membrane protein assembly factor BamB